MRVFIRESVTEECLVQLQHVSYAAVDRVHNGRTITRNPGVSGRATIDIGVHVFCTIASLRSMEALPLGNVNDVINFDIGKEVRNLKNARLA
jgi:hypothetical protein